MIPLQHSIAEYQQREIHVNCVPKRFCSWDGMSVSSWMCDPHLILKLNWSAVLMAVILYVLVYKLSLDAEIPRSLN